jgi:integrase/recombinase XerD
MSVKLRTKILKNGNKSYYLDIYHQGKRKYDFLGIEIIAKPKGAIQKKTNKNNIELAERIRANTEAEILNGKYKFTPKFVEKTDFFVWAIDYIDKTYQNSINREFKAVVEHLKNYTGETTLSMKTIDTDLLEGFQNYLRNESGLNNSTPSQYFAKLKTLIKIAAKKGYIQNDPAKDIRNIKEPAKAKCWLSFDEIQILENTPCKTPDIKNSFLFSCNTGLRHIDLFNLTWNDINLTEKNISIEQQKTGEPLIINLNNNALHYLGEKQNPGAKVFPALKNSSTDNAKLKAWVKQSGITKHISYHVSRHSFATNCLYYGSDALTVSKLLGHTSLKYVMVYVKIVESLKSKAVNNLPETKKSGK